MLQDDGGLELEDGEEELGRFLNVRLVEGKNEEGVVGSTEGSLFVTSSRLVWVRQSNSMESHPMSWGWRDIALHAISRPSSSSSLSSSCVYVQLGVPSDRQDDENFVPHDMRFVPADETKVTDMYECMSRAAAMNPDPMSESGEEMADVMFGESGEEDE